MKPIRVEVRNYPAGRHDYPFHPRATLLTLDACFAAPTRVAIWLAPSETSPVQHKVMIYDSAFQTNPAADSTQFLMAVTVEIPRNDAANSMLPTMRLFFSHDADAETLTWRVGFEELHQ